MVRLIQKCGYIKAGQGGKAAGHLDYIATRKGVEILPGEGPVSPKQQTLIRSLLRDFPDSRELFEYKDYCRQPTQATATAFISAALDFNMMALEKGGYMQYIANRPGVEKRAGHGLFSAAKSVDLETAMEEVNQHSGPVWTIIYSLQRPDAVRLGYDQAAAWQTLLRSKQAEFAAALKIPARNLIWYAAYHDKGHHPHIHMMLWSKEAHQGYLTKDGVLALRSSMTNTIFQDEMLYIYQRKDIAYRELTAAAKAAMTRMIVAMENGVCDNPRLETLLAELAERLPAAGKKQYGYLPKPLKALVNQIVDELAQHPEVAGCYEEWNKLRDAVESYYKDAPRGRLPLSQQKEFAAVRNIVVREAARLAGLAMGQDQAGIKSGPTASGNPAVSSSPAVSGSPAASGGPSAFGGPAASSGPAVSGGPVASGSPGPQVSVPPGRDADLFMAATRILRDVARVFRDNSIPPANPAGPRIDSKRRREIMEKRLAQGQRLDDTMQSMG